MTKKTFSIFSPIVDGFKGFRQYWMLLLCAGSLLSSIHLFDAYRMPVKLNKQGNVVAQDLYLFDAYLMPIGLGILYQTMGHEITRYLDTKNFPFRSKWKSEYSFYRQIRSLYNFFNGNPGPYGYGLAFLVLQMFLMFGLIGICLGLGTKKKFSLLGLLPDARQFARMLGATAIVSGVFFLFGIGLDALDVALSPGYLFFLAVLLVFLGSMTYFAFVAFCAADKAKSVSAVISCSVNLVRGNVMRLFAFACLFACLFTLSVELLAMLLLLVCTSFFPSVFIGFNSTIPFLVGTIVYPFSVMVWTSAYKHLK
jgi:hypothetical protein